MKMKLRNNLTFLLLLLAIASTNAQTFDDNGLRYTVTSSTLVSVG